MGLYASSGWSDLPIDLLIRILHLLELPEALAFRAICSSWRSASKAANTNVPPRRTLWLVSLPEGPSSWSKPSLELWDPTSSFRNLLDGKTFQVSFSWGHAVALCGASHGWLIMANELSDLVLYDPFTAALIPLPPITSFECIKGVYGDDKGNALVGYGYTFFKCDRVRDLRSLGMDFYDKVVLSGSPSAGRTVALSVYLDGKRLSFARVGDACWRLLSIIHRTDDSFADCVYHRGRFYVVMMRGSMNRNGCYKLQHSGLPIRDSVYLLFKVSLNI